MKFSVKITLICLLAFASQGAFSQGMVRFACAKEIQARSGACFLELGVQQDLHEELSDSVKTFSKNKALGRILYDYSQRQKMLAQTGADQRSIAELEGNTHRELEKLSRAGAFEKRTCKNIMIGELNVKRSLDTKSGKCRAESDIAKLPDVIDSWYYGDALVTAKMEKVSSPVVSKHSEKLTTSLSIKKVGKDKIIVLKTCLEKTRQEKYALENFQDFKFEPKVNFRCVEGRLI